MIHHDDEDTPPLLAALCLDQRTYKTLWVYFCADCPAILPSPKFRHPDCSTEDPENCDEGYDPTEDWELWLDEMQYMEVVQTHPLE